MILYIDACEFIVAMLVPQRSAPHSRTIEQRTSRIARYDSLSSPPLICRHY